MRLRVERESHLKWEEKNWVTPGLNDDIAALSLESPSHPVPLSLAFSRKVPRLVCPFVLPLFLRLLELAGLLSCLLVSNK